MAALVAARGIIEAMGCKVVEHQGKVMMAVMVALAVAQLTGQAVVVVKMRLVTMEIPVLLAMVVLAKPLF